MELNQILTFLTSFEVFRNARKHCFECLIYLLNQMWNVGENWKKNRDLFAKAVTVMTSFVLF